MQNCGCDKITCDFLLYKGIPQILLLLPLMLSNLPLLSFLAVQQSKKEEKVSSLDLSVDSRLEEEQHFCFAKCTVSLYVRTVWPKLFSRTHVCRIFRDVA